MEATLLRSRTFAQERCDIDQLIDSCCGCRMSTLVQVGEGDQWQNESVECYVRDTVLGKSNIRAREVKAENEKNMVFTSVIELDV